MASLYFLTACALLVLVPCASAQSTLFDGIASVTSTDTTIDGQEATTDGTGLHFNPDGTISVVVNGQDLFTIPGLTLNSPATAPAYQGGSVPSPGSSTAVDVQVAATDLPGVIAGLASLNLKGPPAGRKMI